MLCTVARWGDSERVALLLSRGVLARGWWDSKVAAIEGQEFLSQADRELPQAMLDLMPEALKDSLAQRCRREREQEAQKIASAPSWLDIPLFAAAESGNAACMTLLIEAGADPLTRDCEQHTAMYHAGSVEVVRLLQVHGANIEERDPSGWSALMHA
ncbi:MAG: ankyrin repeat domain-containing protein, partial [Planctomycetota bacterium]|nr:ankyrin repeat domain-containing protein [Planctomycetota bacterium]